MQSILNNRCPVDVTFTETDVIVTLSDESKISHPLDWHVWLQDATPQQRQHYELYASSVFWPDLDEGLDIEAMLRGIQPRRPQPSES